jgi:oxygen-independent coproporphyrinogen-3 oxidase
MDDLSIVSTLDIDHVSAYDLTLEEGTLFYNKPEVKKESVKLAIKFFDRLKKMGFEQYEISNFAKNDDAKSKHNLGYWQYKSYLGIGAGAVGSVNNVRFYPSKSIEQYIKNPIKYDIESLTNEDVKIEKILLGLRSKVGVCLDLFSNIQQKRVKDLIDANKLKISNNFIYNSDYLLADEIALYITEVV